MEEEQKNINVEQAMSCLKIKNNCVHSFVEATFGLVGADWNIEDVKSCLTNADRIEIGGERCRALGHGIVAIKGSDIWFFEADNNKIKLIDKNVNAKNEFVKSKMQKIARKVNEELPNGYGFTVLVFNFGESKDNELMYVSNANRQDIVKVMEEWIEKTKENFGNDTGKY